MTNSKDPIVLSKAEALKSAYMFCVRYDLEIVMNKNSLKIGLPCGAEMSANFDPVGCEYEAGRLIYKQLLAAKKYCRELQEKEQEAVAATQESAGIVESVAGGSCFDEKGLLEKFLKESV